MTGTAPPLPYLPTLGEPSATFWRGGSDNVLRFLRCNDCDLYLHPPAPVCRRCFSRATSWQPVSGLGTVKSLTIRMTAFPGLHEFGSNVIAIVSLDEQPDLSFTTNIVGDDPHAAYVGQRVQVRFAQIEDVTLPMFEPAIGTQKLRTSA